MPISLPALAVKPQHEFSMGATIVRDHGLEKRVSFNWKGAILGGGEAVGGYRVDGGKRSFNGVLETLSPLIYEHSEEILSGMHTRESPYTGQSHLQFDYFSGTHSKLGKQELYILRDEKTSFTEEQMDTFERLSMTGGEYHTTNKNSRLKSNADTITVDYGALASAMGNSDYVPNFLGTNKHGKILSLPELFNEDNLLEAVQYGESGFNTPQLPTFRSEKGDRALAEVQGLAKLRDELVAASWEEYKALKPVEAAAEAYDMRPVSYLNNGGGRNGDAIEESKFTHPFSGGAWNLEGIPVERADQGADDDDAYEFGTPHKVTVHDTLISNSQAVLKGHFDKHNKQFGHLRTGHRSTLPRDGGKVTGGETFHEVTFWIRPPSPSYLYTPICHTSI